MSKKHDKPPINIPNKKAYHDYEIVDKYECGIQLLGTEIKSLRQGKANLNDSFCHFIEHELWAIFHIAEYSHGGYVNHIAKRERRLLLSRRELDKLEVQVSTQGMTIIPTRLFINQAGWAKLEIALARGKKHHDKREDLKLKDAKREMDRARNERY